MRDDDRVEYREMRMKEEDDDNEHRKREIRDDDEAVRYLLIQHLPR